MTSASDALVVFGITGDLAYKQIFPALQAMIQRGHLDVPIVGVDRSGNLDLLGARARDSLDKHGGVDEKAFAQFCARLQYIAGDYEDRATFEHLRQALPRGGRRRRRLVGRNLRGGAPRDRYLAVGRCSLLTTDGQAPASDRHRGHGCPEAPASGGL